MRLELLKRTDLSLRALELLAGADATVAGSTLASDLNTTTTYLPHVMKPLTARGWVTATSGPNGGYRFEGDLDEISVLDVVEAVEGTTDQQCVLKGAPCPTVDTCAFHVSWVKARDALVKELGGLPLRTALGPASVKGE